MCRMTLGGRILADNDINVIICCSCVYQFNGVDCFGSEIRLC